MRIELHSWPPRAGSAVRPYGALAIELDTGVAVFVNTERTPAANQRLAEERLVGVLTGALTPGEWMLTAGRRPSGGGG